MSFTGTHSDEQQSVGLESVNLQIGLFLIQFNYIKIECA